MLSVILIRVSLKKHTSLKNHENPYYIDLILTNSPNSFKNSFAMGTALSDFHKITDTILKIRSEKLKPRIEHYQDYKTKSLSNDKFREYLLSKLPMENISTSLQGFTHRISWWGNILTKISKILHENCKSSVL